MIPVPQDAEIVWRCFVIAKHRDGVGISDIIARSRRERMPMTRADVLQILRRYVDRLDNDVRQTRAAR